MRNIKTTVFILFVLQLLFTFEFVGHTEQVTRPVTYGVEFKPLGDGIDWEGKVPEDFDAVHLLFTFRVDPGTVSAEINGNIEFDQDNRTLGVHPRFVKDDEGKLYVGKLSYSGGVILSGEIVFDFVLPIPFFPDIPIDYTHPIPSFPQINKSWANETAFNSFLLGEDDSVQVTGGIRKLLSVDITVVEIAEILAIVLSQGTLPQKIADKAGKIIKKYLGDGGIKLNGGLENRFRLSGIGIIVDGQLIRSVDQTVSTPGLDPNLSSYSIQSSYDEKFSAGLDFVITSDIFFNFAPFGIEVWSYEKEIFEFPIPIVPDIEVDVLDFATTPEIITFPVSPNDSTPANRAPEASGTISPQTVRINDAHTTIDISDKFTDPDNDTLSYTIAISNPSVLTTQTVANQVTLLPWSAGSAIVTITAADPDGLTATQTFSVTVLPSTTVNRAPIAIGTISTKSLYVGGFSSTIDILQYFSDPDGDSLTYTAISANTHVVSTEVLTGSRIRVTPEGNGSATVTVTASDGSLTAIQTFSVNVSTLLIIGNRAPIAQGTINARTMTVGDASTTINVSGYFSDPDGDTLTYTVTSNDENVVSVQRTGSSSIRLTPASDGSATVTVTASDSSLSATQNFSVTVEEAPNDISDSPDVVVENISADYVNNYPGERYTVSATVRNAGGGRASHIRLRYYLSDDATYSTDDEEYEGLDDATGVLGSGEESRESVALDALSEQGSYYIIARVARVPDERNTSNNYASIKITVLPPKVPDLVVSLSANKYLVDANDYFKLIGIVRNVGKEDASSGTTLRFYASTDATLSSDDEEIGTEYIKEKQIEEGESEDEYFGLRAPQKPGAYYYFARVDSVDNERETDNNFSNVVIINVRGPDLVIDSVSVDYFPRKHTTVNPNGHFELQATVRNQGTDYSSSTYLHYYVSSDATLSDDDTEIDTADWVHSLDPGETEVEATNYPIRTNYVSGFFYCFVCIDEVEDEIDTDNNCSDPIKIKVRNVAPRANGQIPAQTLNVGTPRTLDISDYFTDENKDPLTYTANSSDTNIATASVSNAQVLITPMNLGNTTITVTANDGALTGTQTISVSVAATVSEETWMPDANLRAATRSALGLNAGDPLTKQKMTELTSLEADSRQIINLTGLEYATNLTRLIVPRNEIRDLTPLQNLTTLTYIDLHYNPISDLTPLQNLIALTVLHIGANQMTNITPLGNLTALTELWLPYNDQISDFTPLRNLTALTKLILYQTQMRDLTPLENLTGLTELWLYDNGISDIEPLKSLTALTFLQIQNNQISDVSSLEGLTALRTLRLSGNPIADYTPLRSLKDKNPNLSTDITIPTPNRAPVAVGTISAQSLTVGGSSVAVDVSGNFSDADNDTLTYTASSSDTSVATVSMSNAQITITPIAAGSATITITASDGSLTATQTIAVNVAPVTNRAPIAVGTISAQSLIVGGLSVSVDVSDNFSDADNDTLTYTANSSNASVATVNVSGAQVTITPVATGSATITVTANDGSLTATQTIAVNVAPVTNRAPIAVGTISAQSLIVGGLSVSVDVSDNFSDADNDTLTYTANSSNTSVATVTVSGAQVTITPVTTGSATITITADDGSLTATQTIAVTVNTALVGNRAPIAVGTILAQSLIVGGSSVSVDVSGNFSDADNDTLTYTASSSNTSIATVSISNAQVTITPVAAGSATITVTANDGELTATQTISVTVTTSTSEETWMPDAVLRAKVRAALGLQAGEELTQQAMTQLTSLSLSSQPEQPGILNPTGLEHATQLRTLFLSSYFVSGNRLSDITPLQNLTNLTDLNLGSNNISDITPLRNLTNLTRLILQYNRISDITPLQNLTSLSHLSLIGNQINDVTPLENLTSLTTLYLGGNSISDLDPLRRLKQQNLLLTIDIDIGPLTPNRAPVTVGTISARTLTAGASSVVVDVSANFSDPDNDTLTYTASSSNTGVATASVSGTQVTITPVAAGSTTITVTASDGTLAATQTTSVTVTAAPVANRAPITVGAIANQTLIVGNPSVAIDVSGYFSDPDNNTLTYTASSSGTSIATVTVSSAQVTITPVAAGNATITVTASDGSLTAAQTIAVSVTATVSEETWMPDAVLRAAVRATLQLQQGEALTQQAMTGLTGVGANGKQISDLTGLEHATNITSLRLDSNQISDLTPLQNLTEITYISLYSNPINSITPLQNLTKLTSLTFGNNLSSNYSPVPIGDITPLQNLTKLTSLTLKRCQISDITPLQNLTNLTQLNLAGNSISNLTPLQNLTKLTSLELYNNSISNLTPLQNLTNLTNLILRHNSITDITALQNLTKLTSLWIRGNQVSNITALQNLTELTSLYAEGCSISDITPLAKLTKLKVLHISSNQVSDITTLQNLTQLIQLDLRSNQISNVTSLEGLTTLKTLYISGNQISDYAPLRRLKAKNLDMGIDITIPPAPAPNNAPVAVGTISAQSLTAGGSSVSVGVSGNFSDADNDTLTYTASSSSTSIATVSVSNAQVTITPVAAGSATITVTASDGSLTATQTIAVTVAAAVTNRAPVAVGTISAQSLTVGGSSAAVDVSSNFSDADNDTLTYTASSSSTSIATVSVSSAQVTITPVAVGSATITVTASDGSLTATQTIAVTVAAAPGTNRAPVAVGTISAQSLTAGGSSAAVDVSSNFSDADNDTLTYTASSSSTSIATVSMSNAQVTITPVAAGSSTITVTASDGSLTATQTIAVTVSSPTPISIPDTKLAAAVRSALGLGTNGVITQVNILRLTYLDAQAKSIANLTGLEHATNLTFLLLSGNAISDVDPLKSLTKLTNLWLNENNISDVDPLKSLTKLTTLLLDRNAISDVDPLKSLTKLTNLSLWKNDISDVDPLKSLTNLTTLSLNYNDISDVTPLKNLTNLHHLYLYSIGMSDVTPLKDFTSLIELNLGENAISDVDPLKSLTNLTGLLMEKNDISDITPLKSLTNLKYLALNDNDITALPTGFFKGFSNLNGTNLRENPGTPFTLTLQLARTDNTDLTAASPATVKVKLAEGTPFDMSVTLSVTGGTLSSTTATIAKGSTESSAITVTQSGAGATTVTLGTAPTVPSSYRGIQTAVGSSLVLFSSGAGPSAVMEQPSATTLLPNYPNPFNPETWIPYQLSKSAKVTLTIYNIRGVVVRQLALGHKPAGVYYTRTRAAYWDGRNNLGEKVGAGLYFVKFSAGNYTAVRKMVIKK